MRKSLLRMPCPQDAPGVDVEEPHSERSEQAIEANCLRLLGQNARRICELLSQGQLPDVQGRQREPQNDPAVHPRLG
jgi:hypothetical protein